MRDEWLCKSSINIKNLTIECMKSFTISLELALDKSQKSFRSSLLMRKVGENREVFQRKLLIKYSMINKYLSIP